MGYLNLNYNLHPCLIFIIIISILFSSNCLESQSINVSSQIETDENGYVAYCPCMGRFGNQADQFLGALDFSKKLNRTLILPPWIEYIPYKAGSLQIPFDKYFNVSALEEFHRVITMELFMDQLAPTIWPPDKRISFCYTNRGNGKGCDAKEGNPFGPFWDRFNVDFIKSEIFGPNLHYSSNYMSKLASDGESWAKYSDAQKWPVLAFVGPPSVFPVESSNVHLHKYLVWNNELIKKAKDFISTLPKGPFIGIHLRNGIDWSRACELVDGSRELFASPQCTGYRGERGVLVYETCFPSLPTLVRQLKRGIRKLNATSVFVASDSNHMLDELSSSLIKTGVSFHKLQPSSPHVDLAILGLSNLFIGNCVSSFSAFVKRERDERGFVSEFWAFPPTKHNRLLRDEL